MLFRYYAGIVVVFIAFVFGTVRYNFIKKEFRLLFIYVCISAGTQLIVSFSEFVGIKNNLPGLHFYLLVEYFLMLWFYLKQLGSFINRKWILTVSALFLVYSLINTFLIQGLLVYPNISRSIEALLLVILSVSYFSKVMDEAKIEKLSKEPMIWFNTAVLIYFAGNFFFNVLFNVILEFSREFSKFTSTLNSVLIALYYILIAVGFWKTKYYYQNVKIKKQSR